jgi:hypothetical protein
LLRHPEARSTVLLANTPRSASLPMMGKIIPLRFRPGR